MQTSGFDHDHTLIPGTVDNSTCLNAFTAPSTIVVDGKRVTIDVSDNLSGRVGIVKYSPNPDNPADPLVHLTEEVIVPLSQVFTMLNHQNNFVTEQAWILKTLTTDLNPGKNTLKLPDEILARMPLNNPLDSWTTGIQVGSKKSVPVQPLTPSQQIESMPLPPDTILIPDRLTSPEDLAHHILDTVTLHPNSHLTLISAQSATPEAIALYQAITNQLGYQPETVADATRELFDVAKKQQTLASLPDFVLDLLQIQDPTTTIIESQDLSQAVYLTYVPLYESIGTNKQTLVVGVDTSSGNLIAFEVSPTQIDLITHQITLNGATDPGMLNELENQWRMSQEKQYFPLASGSPGSVLANTCHRRPENQTIQTLSEHCRLASDNQPVQVTIYDKNGYSYVVFLPAGTHGRAVARINPLGDDKPTMVMVKLDYYNIDLSQMDPASADIMETIFGSGISPSEFYVEIPLTNVHTTSMPRKESRNLDNTSAITDLDAFHRTISSKAHKKKRALS